MSQSNLKQLLKGVVAPLMLFIIGELPTHGYQIGKELDKRSYGYFKLAESTIYSALRRLEGEGLVLSSWQQVSGRQRRRRYELTERGRQILSASLVELQRFFNAASKIMGYQQSASIYLRRP